MALTVSRTAAAGILTLALVASQDAPLVPEGQSAGPINVSVQAAPTEFVRCGEEIPVTVTVTGANGRAVKDLLLRSGFVGSWSPDGSRIAFSNGGIHTMDLDGSNIQRLTDDSNDSSPAWSGCTP
jgi:hypothetical protein